MATQYPFVGVRPSNTLGYVSSGSGFSTSFSASSISSILLFAPDIVLEFAVDMAGVGLSFDFDWRDGWRWGSGCTRVEGVGGGEDDREGEGEGEGEVEEEAISLSS